MDSHLKEIINDIRRLYRLESEKSKLTFKTSSNLGGRFRSDVTIRQHSMTIDEPASLGGTDEGPSPVEIILAALGSCQEITYRAYATAMGIDIGRISVELEGDIDFRGFFGVDEAVRPGYDKIRATVTIESNAPENDIDKLRQVVNRHCPVLDILCNSIPVELNVIVEHGE